MELRGVVCLDIQNPGSAKSFQLKTVHLQSWSVSLSTPPREPVSSFSSQESYHAGFRRTSET